LLIPAGKLLLPPGEYVVGRAPECHIVLGSARASRRHARLVVDDYGASIEDLGSANGVVVNGTHVSHEQRALAPDDFVAIGDQLLEIAIEPAGEVTDAAQSSPVLATLAPPTIPAHAVTNKATGLELIHSVAERALRDGHPERAERVLDEWLHLTLRAARSGKPSEPHVNELALKLALDLASALKSPRWIEYSLQLMSELGRPMTAALANELKAAIETVRSSN
jgi:hypothetical protein